MAAETPILWPLVLYGSAVVLTTSALVAISYVLGQRHREPATDIPYESGMTPTGSARLRFPSDFYLIAMFFVIFSLGTIFIFAWAVAARDVGWPGYAGVLAFIGVLAAALAYLWRSGALDWRVTGRSGTFSGGTEDLP